MSYALTHCHSDMGSNVLFLDCISKPKNIVNRCIEAGIKGVVITDHGAICSAVEMLKQRDRLAKEGKELKIFFGIEAYLIDETEYKNTRNYYHAILIAKNLKGFEQIKKLSSLSWERSYMDRGVRRVPMFYQDIEKLEEKGNLIFCSACLGSFLDKAILEKNADKVNWFLNWGLQNFGEDNFYLELQPNDHSPEQIEVNAQLLRIAKQTNIPWIITTDAHYVCKEDKSVHAAFLNSKEAKGFRETEPFYDYTYIMDESEIYSILESTGISKEDIKTGLDNTLKIMDSVEDYDFCHKTIIPTRKLPPFAVKNLLSDYYEKYPFIKFFSESQYEQDRYLLYSVENGLIDKKIPITDEIANRLNIEFEVIKGLSEYHKQPMSSYFNLCKDMIDIVWAVSPVMPGRGSCTGFLTCYLMGITQINPLKYNLPWFRFLNLGRVDDFPDTDSDLRADKTNEIMSLLREAYGQDCVLNTLTFKTITLKASILTAARALGINVDEAQSLSAMVPMKRGKMPTLEGVLNGDDEIGTPPVPELVEKLKSYPNLYEIVDKIQGLCAGISIHASSVYVFSNGYLKQNALMRAPNGTLITAFNMHDSDDMGALKMDLLKTMPPTLFSKCMSYMLKDGVIDWQGSLRKTWDKYFHPDVIDYSNEELWDNICKNKVLQLFQFGDSQQGKVTIKKVQPHSLEELSLANGVMRLTGNYDGETPTDRFVRYKFHPEQAIQEMKSRGLTDHEIELIGRHLKESFFVSISQEQLMTLLLDQDICGMPLRDVNGARKILAKKLINKLPKLKEDFYRLGQEKGNRKEFLDEIWNYDLLPQLSYSFSKNHSHPYSSIGVIEAWLVTKYNPLYWDCAVLSTQAGGEAETEENVEDFLDDGNTSEEQDPENQSEEEDKKFTVTNYGKIARGIAMVQKHGVVVGLPDVNKSLEDFYPDIANNQIMYGLQAVTNVNPDLASKILSERADHPFVSIKDFVDRINPTNLQMLSLIKGGAFDSLYSEKTYRKAIMRDYLELYAATKVEYKDKLTATDFKKMIELKLVPKEFSFSERVMNYKKWIDANELNKETKRYIIKSEASIIFFKDYYENQLTLGKDYDIISTGYSVKQSSIKKISDQYLKETADFMASDKAKSLLYNAKKEVVIKEIEDKYLQGSISKWEMDSLHYYYHDHELAHILNSLYKIKDFDTLPEEPVVLKVKKNKQGVEIPVYDTCSIAGTVINADNNKHIVTLLTHCGTVVDVKFFAGSYIMYNKQISTMVDNGKGKSVKQVIEKSWFERGNLLLIHGYKRELSFIPRSNYDSGFKFSVALITEISDKGIITLKTEREDG